jgi:hypothetical protein
MYSYYLDEFQLFREITAYLFYEPYDSQIKYRTFCRQNAEVLNAEAGNAYINHCILTLYRSVDI